MQRWIPLQLRLLLTGLVRRGLQRSKEKEPNGSIKHHPYGGALFVQAASIQETHMVPADAVHRGRYIVEQCSPCLRCDS